MDKIKTCSIYIFFFSYWKIHQVMNILYTYLHAVYYELQQVSPNPTQIQVRTHTQTLVLTVTLSLVLCQAQRWTCKWILRLISVLLQNSCHCRKPLELLDVVYSLPTGRALSMPASSLWADECCMTTVAHSQPSYSSRRRSSQRGLYACCASVHVCVC